jgi:peptidyl-tRNA hydrolase, PTH2 family
MADRTPPTPLAMLIGTAVVSLIAGYMLGIASTLGLLPVPSLLLRTHESEVESSAEEIDIDNASLDHAPNWVNGEAADRRDGLRPSEPLKTETGPARPAWELSSEECKLVLVVRTDLGMTKGICNTIFLSSTIND